jgi:hypothetical protein
MTIKVSPPLVFLAHSHQVGKLNLHIDEPIFPKLSPSIAAMSAMNLLHLTDNQLGPTNADFPAYFTRLNTLNQIMSLALQLRQDLNLTNHKYMAHQLALLHQSVSAGIQAGFGQAFTPFKSTIEQKFTDIKSMTSSSASPQLDYANKQWISSLCQDLLQTISALTPKGLLESVEAFKQVADLIR